MDLSSIDLMVVIITFNNVFVALLSAFLVYENAKYKKFTEVTKLLAWLVMTLTMINIIAFSAYVR